MVLTKNVLDVLLASLSSKGFRCVLKKYRHKWPVCDASAGAISTITTLHSLKGLSSDVT